METQPNEPTQPLPAFDKPATLLSTTPTGCRHDGWTGAKMAAFLETLADTGIVIEACEAAAMSPQSAYALRRRSAAFAAGWDGALTIAREKLADTLLARSIEGNVELILRDGVIVGERQVIDNRLGLAILRRLDRLAETGCAVSPVGRSVVPFPGGGRGPGAQRPPAPARQAPVDWDLALTALRTGEAGDLAAALAMFKSCEVDEVDTPPNPLIAVSEPSQDEAETVDHFDRCWRDEAAGSWMTDFPPPPGFDGYATGTWGESGYVRRCTDEEAGLLDAIHAADAAAVEAEDAATRDGWFALLRDELAGGELAGGEPEDERPSQPPFNPGEA